MGKSTAKITKPKNRKVLIGIITAAVLIMGIICGSITLAGNSPASRMEKELNLGNKYLSELDYERALISYQQVLEIEPKNLDAYKGALQASEGLGDRDGMEGFFVAALDVIEGMNGNELEPFYDTAVEIYLCAGTVYSEDHETAAQILERGFDILSRSERLIRALIKEYGILAGIYIEAGDYEKEEAIYQKIVDRKLENFEALSDWEQRVRERFQDYISKIGRAENAPKPTAEPTPKPTPETTAEPTPETTPEPTPELTPEPAMESFVQTGTAIDSGEYKGLSWLVTDAGELVVTGHMEGERLDADSIWTEAPWRQYNREIKVACVNFTGAKSLRCFFGRPDGTLSYLKKVYMSGLDTSGVTDMSGMFRGCKDLSSLDLSGFDTSSVTDMSEMFRSCHHLGSVDMSGLNTGSVTDMSEIFRDCESLSSVNLNGLNTGSVTNMYGMFFGCFGLSSVDLSSFDTSSVTSMRRMFDGCSGLGSLDLSGFDTSSVTDMNGMFYNCRSLSSVNLSSFDTGSVTDMNMMFSSCKSLSSVDLSSFDTRSVKNMGFMFNSCGSLQEILVGDGWYVPAKKEAMFSGCGVSGVTHK